MRRRPTIVLIEGRNLPKELFRLLIDADALVKTALPDDLRDLLIRLHVDLVVTAELVHAPTLKRAVEDAAVDVPILLLSNASLAEASTTVSQGLVDDVIPAWMPTSVNAQRLIRLAQRSLRGEEVVHGMPRGRTPSSRPSRVELGAPPAATTPRATPPTRPSSTTPPPRRSFPSTPPPPPPPRRLSSTPPPRRPSSTTPPPPTPSTIPPPAPRAEFPPSSPEASALSASEAIPASPQLPSSFPSPSSGSTPPSASEEGPDTVRPTSIRAGADGRSRAKRIFPIAGASVVLAAGALYLLDFHQSMAGLWSDHERDSTTAAPASQDAEARDDPSAAKRTTTDEKQEAEATAPSTQAEHLPDAEENDAESIFRMKDSKLPGCDQRLADWEPALPLAEADKPKRAVTHRRLAQGHLMRGEADKATLALCKAATLYPGGRATELLIAQFLTRRSLGNAEEWVTRALEATPDDEDLQKLRADILNQQGRPDDAKRKLLDALNLEDDPSVLRVVASRFIDHGQTSMRAADYARGERYLRRALTLHPDHAGASALLAHALSRQGEAEASRAWAERARDLK